MSRSDRAPRRGAPPGRHPDLLRWNARYADEPPAFRPHPLVEAALDAGLPEGPVLELACGRSGSALALARRGRSVIAVDISDVALRQLGAEADRRGLRDRVHLVQADAQAFDTSGNRFALVLATLYWDPAAFRIGCAVVAPGGLIGWEALTAAQPRRFHVRHGELSAHLPGGFQVLSESLVQTGARVTTRLLARATAGSPLL
ncbi:SAM-dependent methyltransferase [Saccharomonospora amisosensis]|uniref:SAM-dependent methyltransferase n=1 Tax=Saccharomonospora amisosensis TaxID=1128677 RepID=A0A7X5UN07_9PSEU|nr:class I SAM-dependent methyltransferase [Saccharomonospora amisosensis]NIJ11015.1 SAM-dependent methyltransferase [Saccharomonospora amisosensis]